MVKNNIFLITQQNNINFKYLYNLTYFYKIYFLNFNTQQKNYIWKLNKFFFINSNFLITSSIHISYNFLITSQFIQFFNYLLIDIPTCFKNSKSLLRSANKLIFIKWINFLMKNGKKLQTQNILLQNFITFFFKNNLFTNYQFLIFWKLLYINFKSFLYSNFYQNEIFSLYYKNFSNNNKYIDLKYNIFFFFLKKFFNFIPLFSFYIYKIDKKIYKNTRGKSGKFTFFWKYITSYKRLFWVLYWVSKELKFQKGKTLKNRLNSLINSIFFNLNSIWIIKIKKFSYNYIYQNCKNSLQENYRTVLK